MNSLLTICIGLATSIVVFSSTPILVLKGTYPDAAGDMIEQVTVLGDYA
jgi:hypothetical protein